MDFLGGIASAIAAPALFWIAYLYYQDRHRPEPITRIGLSYLSGFAGGALCLRSYDWLEQLGVAPDPLALIEGHGLGFFAYAVTVIGPLEELWKLIPFLLVCVRFRAFDERIDGIIYASAVALGFASYENFKALELLSGFELYGRAIALPLVHSLFASVWGYAFAKARLEGRRVWLWLLVSFVLSALGHGVYDFLALMPAFSAGSALAILAVWVWRRWTIARLQRQAEAEGGAAGSDFTS